MSTCCAPAQGDRVRLVGIEKSPSMNGLEGVVLKVEADKATVKLDRDDGEKAIRVPMSKILIVKTAVAQSLENAAREREQIPINAEATYRVLKGNGDCFSPHQHTV